MPGPRVDASSKPRARRRPTRDVILDAAIDLMMAQGVSATSVEEIARRAGCQRVTVYTHFGSKEGLALSALEALIAEWAHASSSDVGGKVSSTSGLGWDRMLLEVWSADDSAGQRLAGMLDQVRAGLGGAPSNPKTERLEAVLDLIEAFESTTQPVDGAEVAPVERPSEPEIAGRASPTIKEVAERAGVSFKSVSRVINDHPHVTAELRAKVELAMQELGYSPNAVARTLRSASSPTVGLVIDDSEAFPYASDIIRGAQDAATDFGKVLVITYVDGALGSRSQVLDHLRQWQVEGVAYASPHHRVIQPNELLPFSPLVLVNCAPAVPGPAFAVPSEHDGGYMATKILVDAGHRRIGLISGPPEFPASHLRREGYLAALAEANIEPDPALQLTGDWWQEGGAAAAREMMSLAHPPTGIFASNDWMAMGVYDELRSLGVRIPEDVSVVGFDNREVIAAHMRPPLTTVALPYYDMGRWAIEALQHRNFVGGQFSCKLIVRDSVAPKVSS
jgi:LacI family transcriptional regulator